MVAERGMLRGTDVLDMSGARARGNRHQSLIYLQLLPLNMRNCTAGGDGGRRSSAVFASSAAGDPKSA